MKMRSRLRQFLEAKRRLLDRPAFNSIRHRLHAETLWHLNRRSLAGGLAAGLFAAFLPFPAQMLIAAGLAIVWQANMPVALVSTWISNPLTYAPIFYGNYHVGLFILQLFYQVEPQELEQHRSLLAQITDIGAPFLLGSLITASTAAGIGYFFARAFWRVLTIRKFLRRRHRRFQR